MFDVKGVDIKIEIPAPEDFNTIKDRYNLILHGMLLWLITYLYWLTYMMYCFLHVSKFNIVN